MDFSVVSFGMHKGKKWADVPQQYLEWVMREFDKKIPSRKMAKRELLRRSGNRNDGFVPDYSHIIPDSSIQAPWEGESVFARAPTGVSLDDEFRQILNSH